MYKLFLILAFVALFGCNKDDDPKKFTSINGYWVVTTPDDATTVAFRIGQDADKEYRIEAVDVRHNGSSYNSKPVDADIIVRSATMLESLTFVTGDPTVPFFVIRFMEISVNADFTEMEIANSTFHIDNAHREFPMLSATR